MIAAFQAAPAFWLTLAGLAAVAIWLAWATEHAPYDPHQDRSRLDDLDRPRCGDEYESSFGEGLVCRRPFGHEGSHRDGYGAVWSNRRDLRGGAA